MSRSGYSTQTESVKHAVHRHHDRHIERNRLGITERKRRDDPQFWSCMSMNGGGPLRHRMRRSAPLSTLRQFSMYATMNSPDYAAEPPQREGVPFACVLSAWRAHETELRGFIAHRSGDDSAADDLLQDVFIKALRQGSRFCELRQPRAWLFEVARNALIDHARQSRSWQPVDDAWPAPETEAPNAVDQLTACIERVLPSLPTDDADVLRACDLQGEPQPAYASRRGLSLPATKSRIQRARQRLRAALVARCGVVLDERDQVCCVRGPTPPSGTRLR